MPRALKVCSCIGCDAHEGSCPELLPSGRCAACSSAAERRRGSAAARGYDPRWERRRLSYLRRNPFCVLDGAVATVADHYPDSRRDLLAMGVRDPDADQRLRALCASCHGAETATHQPGGWNATQSL